MSSLELVGSNDHGLSGRAAIVSVGVLALAILGLWGISGEKPTIGAPWPFTTMLPIFAGLDVTGEAQAFQWLVRRVLPALTGPALLVLWHRRLLWGASDLPRRSVIGLCLLSVLTALWLFEGSGWRIGVEWQGAPYVRTTCYLNVACLALLWVLMGVANHRRSFLATFVFHWSVVAWLVSLAFPWLGD